MRLAPEWLKDAEVVRLVEACAAGRVAIRFVGGAVRDTLLMREVGDIDAATPVPAEQVMAALRAQGLKVIPTGIAHGTVTVVVGERRFEITTLRRDVETDGRHAKIAPTDSWEEDAARRDFTVNAIACDPFTREIIDPHSGQRDLESRVLRHTSAAFAEDPLRVLRGMQLAGRFEFTLAPETAALCRTIADTFSELPLERVWGEWEKWAAKSVTPSRGLTLLEESGWLRHFPELAALRGTPQEPAWHPEGDVFTHTQHCLDALVALPTWPDANLGRRRRLMFAVLAHDFGKPSTTRREEKHGALRWTSAGHEAAGGPLTQTFLWRIGALRELEAPVTALVVNHLAHHHGQATFSDASVRRLARRLAPATITELAAVMRADSNGRPPLASPETHLRINALETTARALEFANLAPKPVMFGRHLIAVVEYHTAAE